MIWQPDVRFWKMMHLLGVHHYPRRGKIWLGDFREQTCIVCRKKRKSLIPRGIYCYTGRLGGEHKTCPYWSRRLDVPEQASGYCAYLGKGDIEINKEKRWTSKIKQADGSWLEDNTLRSAEEMGEQLSMLWDYIKDCDTRSASALLGFGLNFSDLNLLHIMRVRRTPPNGRSAR